MQQRIIMLNDELSTNKDSLNPSAKFSSGCFLNYVYRSRYSIIPKYRYLVSSLP